MQAALNKAIPDQDRGDVCHAWFAATHWSLVLAAGQADPERRKKALETLCQLYWEPLDVYLRRDGKTPQDAEDLTQAFLAHLLEQNPFARLSPAKGRFRSFLLRSLQNFEADAHERLTAAKRGGGWTLLRFDPDAAERHLLEPACDAAPGAAFDHRWATTVLKRAFDALEREFRQCGRAELFAQLSTFLATEGNASVYDATGAALGMRGGAVAVAVHRLRQRYRELIRKEVAHTVPEAEDIESEMHYLFEVLSR